FVAQTVIHPSAVLVQRPAQAPWRLAVAGIALNALLAGFIVLYVNFPPGYDAPYGLSLEAPVLFRALWPYPTLTLGPGPFAALGVFLILLPWGVYLFAARVSGDSQTEAERRQK